MTRTRPEEIKLMLTKDEKKLIARAAETGGLKLSQWARSVLLPAARAVIAQGGAR